MLFYCDIITPRLKYITDFIGSQLFEQPLELTTDKTLFAAGTGDKINYSKEPITMSEFRIEPQGLLFENGIAEQFIQCFEVNDSRKEKSYKTFFKTKGDFPFDIFAASFYLLSRYEEYLPHQKDAYGRYAHQNSLAFKEGFLHLPLINIWVDDFRKTLQNKFPHLGTRRESFSFLPTYDIDEAFSYSHKQWWRTIGGMARSVIKGETSLLIERVNVLIGSKQDPFNSFEWMDQLNHRFSLRPIYFFLVANRTGKYDKNIFPSNRIMQELIERHSNRYSVGIHPSWQSVDDEIKLKHEVLRLGHITGRKIISSRQHFIRFTLPETYRRLIDVGIESDFSMGYGTINGFRASVASSFYWYDLPQEKQTGLMLFPFCFMEANSFFENKSSPQQAFEELKHYHHVTKSANGTLITIWHNTFLGTSKLFAGWREVYQNFVSLV
ncbi:MAG TPA: polysaccharide deacetylase family protein [Chitinophagaceae bacterium]|nr:polysaccharide deacetylase family protein [Chitinophagaceae bacterium]